MMRSLAACPASARKASAWIKSRSIRFRSATSPCRNMKPASAMSSRFSGMSLTSTQSPAPMASRRASDNPSDLEGLSLALLEAMGAGLCVLVSDIPENLELMADAGFMFRHGDVADLKRMLRLLIHADALRAEAGQAARDRIIERYLWPKIAKEIEEAYQE